MKDLIKVLFFVIAAMFFVSYVQDAGFGNLGASNAPLFRTGHVTQLSPPGQYNRAYDLNNDGVVSADEYRHAQLGQVSQEVAVLNETVAAALQEQNRSPYYGTITLSRGNVYSTNPKDEYVVIQANSRNTAPVTITGWKLRSLMSDNWAPIPKGVPIIDSARPQAKEQDVFLAPGEKAIVSSGYAAGINTGFLENKCAGYLQQDYDFSPSIWSMCPRLKDENLAAFGLTRGDFDSTEDFDACMNAIDHLQQCTKGFPPTGDKGVTQECSDFIEKYANYQGCVDLHRTDADFLGKQWRLFLRAQHDFWRSKREAIALLDQNDKTVAVLTYQ